MLNKFFIILVTFLLFQSNYSKNEQSPLLSLSFTEFDQTPNSGWRSLVSYSSSPEEYCRAVNLIDSYITHNKSLTDSELAITAFHAGQLSAFAGDGDKALNYFNKGYTYSLAAQSGQAWLLYVRATIAFLKKDEQELEQCSDELQKSYKTTLGKNAEIVMKLLNNLDKSYVEIYLS